MMQLALPIPAPLSIPETPSPWPTIGLWLTGEGPRPTCLPSRPRAPYWGRYTLACGCVVGGYVSPLDGLPSGATVRRCGQPGPRSIHSVASPLPASPGDGVGEAAGLPLEDE